MYHSEITALLFVAGDQGLSAKEMSNLLEITDKSLRDSLAELEEYINNNDELGFKLVKYNDTYKLVTKSVHSDLLTKYFETGLGSKLSQAALEVLAIVAYRQPVTRVEVDDIRGIQSSGSMNTLLARNMIMENGKKDVPGHPNLYVVTNAFFDYFGIKNIDELPDFETFRDLNSEEEIGATDGED